MDQFLFYFHMMTEALEPYWAEIIGSLLLGMMVNLFRIRGTQKDSFQMVSMAFYALLCRDLFYVGVAISSKIYPQEIMSDMVQEIISVGITALITSLLLVAALKNMRVYFSTQSFVLSMSLLLMALGIGFPVFEPLRQYLIYLPPVYLTVSLLILGLSFYGTKGVRKDLNIRAVGNGFFVLTLCYTYQMFHLVENSQQVLLLGYMIAMVLSLAAQIQVLNRANEILEMRLEAEKKSKKESWEMSPFPIMISRLRDDTIIYMNPAAREVLGIRADELNQFKLSQYFANVKKKEELLEQVRSSKIVRNFEVEVCHPGTSSGFWIEMTTRTTDFDEEIVLFSTFKDITDQKRTAQLLKLQAATDPLTRLYNRRQFELVARQVLHIAERYNHPYAMLMLDIDFFKKVNDTYGHAAGDLVLKNLAKVLKEVLRKSDTIARYGGEEFVALLSQTYPEEAKIVAEHIRVAVQNMQTLVSGNQTIPVTVSIGISTEAARDIETLIKQADEALYYSKEHGRNQVSLYREIKDQK